MEDWLIDKESDETIVYVKTKADTTELTKTSDVNKAFDLLIHHYEEYRKTEEKKEQKEKKEKKNRKK